MKIPTIIEKRRLPAPTVTPQALAFSGKGELWMSSRDLGTLCKVDIDKWKAVQEMEAPGVVWAAVQTNGAAYFTIGKGLNDDRYVYRYDPDRGFIRLFACPDFAGSYLSFDGEHLYLSQWYQQRILKMDGQGKILSEIEVGAEICGHTFVDGTIYVLRGTENVPRPDYAKGPPIAEKFKNGAKQGEEQWWIARLNPRDKKPEVSDIAKLPFAARSLTFDGKNFWSNHRAANETICYSLPS